MPLPAFLLRLNLPAIGLGLAVALGPLPSHAQTFVLEAPQASDGLRADLQNGSAARQALSDPDAAPIDIYAAARSDYGRLLGVLYENGHYGGTIDIRVNGRSLATRSPFDTPDRIEQVTIQVTPGPQFRFGRLQIAPLATTDQPTEGFVPGAPARSAVLRQAATAAVDQWRAAGHALARVQDQRITADHRSARLDADLRIAPGPALRFAPLVVAEAGRSNPDRLRRIAGLPAGAGFSPQAIATAAARLRATGAFSSVTLQEAQQANADGTLDVTASVIDAPLRRIGAGAEIATDEGLRLTGFWLHRNLFGGAERLRFDAEIADIGAAQGGVDYALGGSFRRPGTFAPGTDLIAQTELERTDSATALTDRFTASVLLEREIAPDLTGKLGLAYMLEETNLRPGRRAFRVLAFPGVLGFDTRDDPLAPTDGTLAEWQITPYIGGLDADDGVRSYVDFRAYRDLGARLVVAARLQWGAVFGSSIAGTPSDYLFFSGGANTVRGQPFNSLGTSVTGRVTGGRSLLAGSIEARFSVTDSIGVVGFYDHAFVGPDSLPNANGATHAGYGIGLRYQTPIGAIRADIGLPVQGQTGPKLYLGIGQAF